MIQKIILSTELNNIENRSVVSTVKNEFLPLTRKEMKYFTVTVKYSV